MIYHRDPRVCPLDLCQEPVGGGAAVVDAVRYILCECMYELRS